MQFRYKVILLILLVLLASTSAVPQKRIDDLRPTLILIALDGFRFDYLERHNPKFLRKLAANGVRAKWMTPSFPTKTFPNHYTIATGLYPENHGIIANNIYDPGSGSIFKLSKREEVQNPKWWGGEPIWVTAEKAGQKAGAFFFPGTETEIKGVLPTVWRNYDGSIPNRTRVKTLLSWFDRPAEERPTFVTLYFSDVDDAGHWTSPLSGETGKAVRSVDKEIRYLYKGLQKRGIRDKVNVVIVSDHGMAKVRRENRIVLDTLFDTSDARHIFWVGELVQIFPKEGKTDAIYSSIASKLPATAQVYKRDELPERYHYSKHKSIAPILVLPKEGWVLRTQDRLKRDYDRLPPGSSGGSHGYDNEVESMRALFVAHGPAFKKGYVSEPFRNIEVYNLLCKVLGLTPAPNDGTQGSLDDLLKPAP